MHPPVSPYPIGPGHFAEPRPVEVVLHPGDFYFGGAGARLQTLLGSCVSITVWHPGRRIGGMCHYMLPSRSLPGPATGLDGRYADQAVRLFRYEIERMHTVPAEYVAQMFGGGVQIPFDRRPGHAPDVAHGNVEAGLRLLDRYGFRLVHTDTGGHGPRKVLFDIATGDVTVVGGTSTRTGAVVPAPRRPAVPEIPEVIQRRG